MCVVVSMYSRVLCVWLSGYRSGYFDVCGCQDAEQGTLTCVVVRM